MQYSMIICMVTIDELSFSCEIFLLLFLCLQSLSLPMHILGNIFYHIITSFASLMLLNVILFIYSEHYILLCVLYTYIFTVFIILEIAISTIVYHLYIDSFTITIFLCFGCHIIGLLYTFCTTLIIA